MKQLLAIILVIAVTGIFGIGLQKCFADTTLDDLDWSLRNIESDLTNIDNHIKEIEENQQSYY